jgi:hypothetical protein
MPQVSPSPETRDTCARSLNPDLPRRHQHRPSRLPLAMTIRPLALEA